MKNDVIEITTGELIKIRMQALQLYMLGLGPNPFPEYHEPEESDQS